MNTSNTKHIYPDDHWVKMEFCSIETGPLDDKSLGFLLSFSYADLFQHGLSFFVDLFHKVHKAGFPL